MRDGSVGGPVIAVHGGAGGLVGVREDSAEQARIRDGIEAALRAGQEVLVSGGPAVRAVEHAVLVLEERECFNAGHGSFLTSAGGVEMDASIMCGVRGAAGAVAAVTTIVHPISAARVVMEQGAHVLMVGAAAEEIAVAAGLESAAPESFVAAARREQLSRERRAARVSQRPGGGGDTVGAVALDSNGDLAAATSTGGMPNQASGRVGDSPIIGAGTWAANGRCAVSATGSGELVMRACVAHEIDALMRLSAMSIEDAARRGIALVEELGGSMGCVAVDARGSVTLPFNTEAMPRGVARGDREPQVSIF